MVSEQSAKALVEFVRGGGALVSEARLAWNDEKGRAKDVIPGFGLNEVCGCREDSVQMTPTGKAEVSLSDGEKFKGFVYQESLGVAPGAKAIASFADGSPAIVTSEFGKGRMMTIGTFLGTAYETDREESLAKFIRSLLDWGGVAKPIDAPSGVEVRVLETAAERLYFSFNHGEKPVEWGVAHGIDLETGARVHRKVLAPQEVWIVRVGK
jgi:hypothetical protein